MTGEWATEPSDLAGTGLGAVTDPVWSPDLLAAAGVPLAWLPPIRPSVAVAGYLRAEAARALGLPVSIPVVAGCADAAGMALAAGVTEPGDGLVTISMGGQALAALDCPRLDDQGRLHTFHHAMPRRWYLLGATLAAGLALRWAGRALLGATDFAALMALAAQAPAGADSLLFQPSNRLALAGGGLQHPLWRQVVADTLGQPLWTVGERDLAATSAARLAWCGGEPLA